MSKKKLDKYVRAAAGVVLLLFAVSCGEETVSVATQSENVTTAETTKAVSQTRNEPETTVGVTVEPEVSGQETTEEKEPEMPEKIVNIEEVDITHDGVPDKIVTYIVSKEPEYSEGKTLEELVSESYASKIRVYDGKGIGEQDTYEPQDCIWEGMYGIPHVGNGQLYLLESNGKPYLLFNSDYIIQGWASFGYRVFYLNEKGEEIIEKEAELPFMLTRLFPESESNFSVEESIVYTEALDELLGDSKLLAYYTVDQTPRASTFEKECSAKAEEIWDFAESTVEQEITMENLREMLEVYEAIVWK